MATSESSVGVPSVHHAGSSESGSGRMAGALLARALLSARARVRAG
ncbi:hypothetical protein [Olsenella uli]